MLVLENIEESNVNLSETEHLAVDLAQLLLLCFEFFAARYFSLLFYSVIYLYILGSIQSLYNKILIFYMYLKTLLLHIQNS